MENEIAARARARARLGSSTASGKCVIYQPYRRYVHSVIHPRLVAGDMLVVICFNNGNIMRVKCTALIHAFITVTQRLFASVICFIRIINARSLSRPVLGSTAPGPGQRDRRIASGKSDTLLLPRLKY